jgi:plastocyanin
MRALITALSIAPLTLGLAACGGGDDKGGSDPPVTFHKGQPVKVSGHEYAFDPKTIVVDGGGGRTTIEFKNAGATAHNLKLVQGGKEVGGTGTFQGGRSESVTVDLKPGTYEMICTVGNHANLGMTGELTVK